MNVTPLPKATDETTSDAASAMKMFTTNFELSQRAEAELPQAIKDKCKADRPENEQDNCQRAMLAGKALADLLGALGGETVNFDTPDTSTVTRTNNEHPAAQCRLDTYVAGALCGAKTWDYGFIPGKGQAQHNSMAAQAEAYQHSCETGDGARPKCWFAALTTDPTGGECPFGDQSICDLLCAFDPTQPFCNQ